MKTYNLQSGVDAATILGTISTILGSISYAVFGWLAYIGCVLGLIAILITKTKSGLLMGVIGLLISAVAAMLITIFYLSPH